MEIIHQETKDVLLNVNTKFLTKVKNNADIFKYARDIHALQFLSFYNPVVAINNIAPTRYWEFIDRS